MGPVHALGPLAHCHCSGPSHLASSSVEPVASKPLPTCGWYWLVPSKLTEPGLVHVTVTVDRHAQLHSPPVACTESRCIRSCLQRTVGTTDAVDLCRATTRSRSDALEGQHAALNLEVFLVISDPATTRWVAVLVGRIEARHRVRAVLRRSQSRYAKWRRTPRAQPA